MDKDRSLKWFYGSGREVQKQNKTKTTKSNTVQTVDM